ncbi:MAG: bifunctional UDP-N-acetylglucosamine diphosphorylase/glucosamine-1-phosphate N-acetyltransferase GlmU [Thermoanaerobaculia bacterium]
MKKSRRVVRRQPRGRGREIPLRVIVLAAGVGSRMRSSIPQALHHVGGRTLLEAVLETAEKLSPAKIIAVVGPAGASRGVVLAGHPVTIMVQDAPARAGASARKALAALDDGGGPVLVLSADVPLLRPETLDLLWQRQRQRRLDLAFLSFRPPEPADFGRVVRDRAGCVRRIARPKGESAGPGRIAEVNAGVYCFGAGGLQRALAGFRANGNSLEEELAEAVGILASGGGRVEAVEASDWREAWGIRTRRDLAAAEEIERRRGIERALDAGASVVDPSTTRIGPRVAIEPDAVIHPFVSLEGRTTLGEGCEILPFTRIADSVVEARAVVGPHCDLEGARVGRRARVGPFARLRPETVLEEDVRVGNFVETKKVVLRRGAKASHLSYLGDAEIGEETNIGAGVITCNYDGKRKHRTLIGREAFIGSDTQLVAPVKVGDRAWVGAGSTITRDVPDGALALTRVPQVNEEGWVERRKKRTKSR